MRELPMNKKKEKWPVKELMVQGQRRLLKRWLRYVKILRDEEEVIHICEPKIGRNLDDEEKKRSVRELVSCHEGRSEN